MDLRLLQTFGTVADLGSVTAAAAALHVTQPALSRQVQQLERQLGVALFVREKRRLHLTAAGRSFLAASTEVLTSAAAATTLAESLAAGRLARVHIASPATTLTDVLAPFLATLDPADPLATVEEAHHAEAIAGLRSRLDLAIVTSPPPRHLETRQVAELPVWAYAGGAHPLAGAAEVSVRQLAEHRLILLDVGSRPRQLVDEALVRAGLAASEVIECSNPQVAQALAAAGRGVAVVSDDPRFGLAPVPITSGQGPLTLTLHAAWDPHHHAAAELERFVEKLRDFCVARYGPPGRPPPLVEQVRASGEDRRPRPRA